MQWYLFCCLFHRPWAYAFKTVRGAFCIIAYPILSCTPKSKGVLKQKVPSSACAHSETDTQCPWKPLKQFDESSQDHLSWLCYSQRRALRELQAELFSLQKHEKVCNRRDMTLQQACNSMQTCLMDIRTSASEALQQAARVVLAQTPDAGPLTSLDPLLSGVAFSALQDCRLASDGGSSLRRLEASTMNVGPPLTRNNAGQEDALIEVNTIPASSEGVANHDRNWDEDPARQSEIGSPARLPCLSNKPALHSCPPTSQGSCANPCHEHSPTCCLSYPPRCTSESGPMTGAQEGEAGLGLPQSRTAPLCERQLPSCFLPPPSPSHLPPPSLQSPLATGGPLNEHGLSNSHPNAIERLCSKTGWVWRGGTKMSPSLKASGTTGLRAGQKKGGQQRRQPEAWPPKSLCKTPKHGVTVQMQQIVLEPSITGELLTRGDVRLGRAQTEVKSAPSAVSNRKGPCGSGRSVEAAAAKAGSTHCLPSPLEGQFGGGGAVGRTGRGERGVSPQARIAWGTHLAAFAVLLLYRALREVHAELLEAQSQLLERGKQGAAAVGTGITRAGGGGMMGQERSSSQHPGHLTVGKGACLHATSSQFGQLSNGWSLGPSPATTSCMRTWLCQLTIAVYVLWLLRLLPKMLGSSGLLFSCMCFLAGILYHSLTVAQTYHVVT